MRQAFFKRNGILLVTLLVYAGVVVGISLALDTMVYQRAKSDLLSKYIPEELFPNVLEGFLNWTEFWHNDLKNGKDPSRSIGEMKTAAARILQGPSSVYRIAVQDAAGKYLFDEKADKFARFNNFDNSLWLRLFSAQRVSRLPALDPSGARPRIWIYFTTPGPSLKVPQIQTEINKLTFQFRIGNLIADGIITIFVFFFLTRVVLPMRNVIGSIEISTPQTTHFIFRPRSRLERLYNGMARDTALARLQERLGERINQGTPMTGWELIQSACDDLIDQRAAALVVCVELAEEGPGKPRRTGRTLVRRGARVLPKVQDATLLDLAATMAFPGESTSRLKSKELALAKTLAVRLADDPERPGIHYVLALGLSVASRQFEPREAETLLARFSAIIRAGLESLVARNRTLVRERDRASINLSRNLGHDLTNIIATSKLELMTLEELLRNGAPIPENQRREILNQSLEGLLNSTRFLQEVVNLYRAYAFLKKPILETHNVNELIGETIRLFRLSTSEKVKFTERLDPSAPKCRIDPRLFKLALFNLFSNALDAIRRAGGKEAEGTITITTETLKGGTSTADKLAITIQDSGTGILNEEGKLADAEQIERIFALGYTLGRQQEGEGLGLNWVKTIVQDIHGGTIRAENAPDGGARFTIAFPAMETAAKLAGS